MTRYVHDPAPSDSARAFIRWCAENISEWKEPYVSVMRPAKTRSAYWKKKPEWRMHHGSLSHAWVVCTKRQWLEARGAS